MPVHDGLSQCSIYYLMSAQGFRNAQRPVEAKQADDASEYLLAAAVDLAGFDHTKERMTFYKNQMMAEINGDYSNFTVLVNQHNENCAFLLNLAQGGR